MDHKEAPSEIDVAATRILNKPYVETMVVVSDVGSYAPREKLTVTIVEERRKTTEVRDRLGKAPVTVHYHWPTKEV